jgi:probable HAF family extracellular repeat protein
LDLGTLGGSTSTPGDFGDINASGQVVGGSDIPGDAAIHAFRTAPNAPITAASDLGTLAGSNNSVASGINVSGEVVGVCDTTPFPDSNVFYAFRTAADGPITAASDLGTLGGTVSDADAINASGQTVGYSNTVEGVPHAYRTAAEGYITPASDLGTLGGPKSYAYGINSSGQTVGSSNIANGPLHPFRTSANGPITAASDLGSLGGTSGDAIAINDSGQVVGDSEIAGNAAAHAFRTAANGPITAASDLGTLGDNFSSADAVNSSGQVVGDSKIAGNADIHAFFCDVTGSMQDLNNLIPAGSGWDLVSATGINDLGQITGYGGIGGEEHAFLLTPTPEPACLALLAMSCVRLLRRRHT